MKRAVLLLVLLAAGGCGSEGPRRYELSGTVTYRGTPLPVGTLLFEPDTGRGNRGPGTLVEVREGRYRTMPGQGVVGGPYLVRITGFDGKGDDRGESQQGRPLFPEQVQVLDLPHRNASQDLAVSLEDR